MIVLLAEVPGEPDNGSLNSIGKPTAFRSSQGWIEAKSEAESHVVARDGRL
jgi:hypothetical protein